MWLDVDLTCIDEKDVIGRYFNKFECCNFEFLYYPWEFNRLQRLIDNN